MDQDVAGTLAAHEAALIEQLRQKSPDGSRVRDVTTKFREHLPFLPSAWRFFAVSPAASPVVPAPALQPGLPWNAVAVLPPPAPTYFAVGPLNRWVKLDHAEAFALPGLHLRNAAQALQFVRVLTASEPYDPILDPAVLGLALTELPTSMVNNCLSFDLPTLRRVGAKPAKAYGVRQGHALLFRVARYMKPVGWPNFGQTAAVPTVYRIIEQVDVSGRYQLLDRRAIPTPHFALHDVCSYQ